MFELDTLFGVEPHHHASFGCWLRLALCLPALSFHPIRIQLYGPRPLTLKPRRCRYADGCGVGQDLAKAANLYQLSADQGLAEAQVKLAYMHCKGVESVPRDMAEAHKLFTSAARQGNAEAGAMLKKLHSQLAEDQQTVDSQLRKAHPAVPAGGRTTKLRRARTDGSSATLESDSGSTGWAYQRSTAGCVERPLPRHRSSEVEVGQSRLRSNSSVQSATV